MKEKLFKYFGSDGGHEKLYDLEKGSLTGLR
jgi:hypothetical protein